MPHKLVVNGRKGRRVLVVLAQDGKHYRVLDLESVGGEGVDDSGEDGEGDTIMSEA